MGNLSNLGTAVADQWPVWLLASALVVAATIDAIRFRVSNWLTYPLVIGGWAYSTAAFGWEGLGWSLFGTVVGFALLFPDSMAQHSTEKTAGFSVGS